MSDIPEMIKLLAPLDEVPPVAYHFEGEPDEIVRCACCDGKTIAYFARLVIIQPPEPVGEQVVIFCRRCITLAKTYQLISL